MINIGNRISFYVSGNYFFRNGYDTFDLVLFLFLSIIIGQKPLLLKKPESLPGRAIHLCLSKK